VSLLSWIESDEEAKALEEGKYSVLYGTPGRVIVEDKVYSRIVCALPQNKETNQKGHSFDVRRSRRHIRHQLFRWPQNDISSKLFSLRLVEKQIWSRVWLGLGLELGLVFGIGLVLVKPLICYVLSLWGQRNINLFRHIPAYTRERAAAMFLGSIVREFYYKQNGENRTMIIKTAPFGI
jgi:hypothetical protein